MNTDQERADFEAWASGFGLTLMRLVSDRRYESMETECAWQAWQARATLQSPEVQELLDALQEVVDAADGDGWDVLDPSLERQRAALAAMEKQK